MSKADDNTRHPLPYAVLGLVTAACWLTLWSIANPYPGITHDGQGYALQALTRLDTGSLARDLFLAYQSQDDFTLFPWVHAGAIASAGLDHGTALLQLSFLTIWYAAAWYMLRAASEATLAWLGAGLLVAVPAGYGAMGLFQYSEPFLTARLPAEALGMASIAAALVGQRRLGVALLVAAFLFHPIMAMPVALLAAGIEIARRYSLSAGIGSIAVFGVTLVVAAIAVSVVQDDPPAAWRQFVESRSSHLFLNRWQLQDWGLQLLSLAALLFLSMNAPVSTRQLSFVALAVSLAGLALACVATAAPQLTLLLQGQPWRWIWIGKVLAVGLAPLAAATAWQKGESGRAAVKVLLAAVLLTLPIRNADSLWHLLPGMLVLGGCALTLRWTEILSSQAKTLRIVSNTVFIASALSMLVTASVVLLLRFEGSDDPGWLQGLRNALNLGGPAIALTCAAWYALWHARTRIAAATVAAACAATLLAVAPIRAESWTAQRWTGPSRDDFGDWRRMIPESAQVLWWDGLRETWFLLGRRSYLTTSQAGGIVFSSELASDILKRAQIIAPYVPPRASLEGTLSPGLSPSLSPAKLRAVCGAGGPDFVVATEDLGTGAPRHTWPGKQRDVYLYDCRREIGRQQEFKSP